MSNNWYISSGFQHIPPAYETIAGVINLLKDKSHVLLLGLDFYYPSDWSKKLIDQSHLWEGYTSGALGFYAIDMKELENRIKTIFLNRCADNENDVEFINNIFAGRPPLSSIQQKEYSIKKILDRFKYIDEKIIDELKYTLRKNTLHSSDIVLTSFGESNVRFRNMPNISLSYSHELIPPWFSNESSITWIEIDENNMLKNALSPGNLCELVCHYFGNLHLIITDDTSNISNYTYYIELFEILHDIDYALAIHDNKKQIDSKFIDLSQIVGKERKFNKATDELIDSIKTKIYEC